MAAETNGASKGTATGSLPQNTSIWHDDATEDEEEWEYEYHETEVEHLYITLDLSDVATSVQLKSKPKAKGKSRQRNASEGHDDEDMDAEGTEEEEEDEEQTTREKLQIMELHGDNPIVSYGGKVYSCRWGSSLGTDMFFANVVDSWEMDIDALRSGVEYDLVGMSAAKLVATNAEIKPRVSASSALAENRLAPEHASGRPLYNLSSASSLVLNDDRRSQMRFLERLNHVKARRQELDKIPTGLFKPSQEFMEKYTTKHIPTGEESENEGPHTSGTQLPLTTDGVRAKPGVRRRAKRSDQTLHGDSSNLRTLLEVEMQKPTPMTLPKFQGSGVKLAPLVPEEEANKAAAEEEVESEEGSEEDSDEGDDDLLQEDDDATDEDEEDEESGDDTDDDNEEIPGTATIQL